MILHDRFIPDEQVKYYFSAVDFVVQPYKTATQSGVTQIAYQFCVPMSSPTSAVFRRSCPTVA